MPLTDIYDSLTKCYTPNSITNLPKNISWPIISMEVNDKNYNINDIWYYITMNNKFNMENRNRDKTNPDDPKNKFFLYTMEDLDMIEGCLSIFKKKSIEINSYTDFEIFKKLGGNKQSFIELFDKFAKIFDELPNLSIPQYAVDSLDYPPGEHNHFVSKISKMRGTLSAIEASKRTSSSSSETAVDINTVTDFIFSKSKITFAPIYGDNSPDLFKNILRIVCEIISRIHRIISTYGVNDGMIDVFTFEDIRINRGEHPDPFWATNQNWSEMSNNDKHAAVSVALIPYLKQYDAIRNADKANFFIKYYQCIDNFSRLVNKSMEEDEGDKEDYDISIIKNTQHIMKYIVELDENYQNYIIHKPNIKSSFSDKINFVSAEVLAFLKDYGQAMKAILS